MLFSLHYYLSQFVLNHRTFQCFVAGAGWCGRGGQQDYGLEGDQREATARKERENQLQGQPAQVRRDHRILERR